MDFNKVQENSCVNSTIPDANQQILSYFNPHTLNANNPLLYNYYYISITPFVTDTSYSISWRVTSNFIEVVLSQKPITTKCREHKWLMHLQK
jgi:hypothetical protein